MTGTHTESSDDREENGTETSTLTDGTAAPGRFPTPLVLGLAALIVADGGLKLLGIPLPYESVIDVAGNSRRKPRPSQ